MPAPPIDQELAILRSLASRGDYEADLLVRTFDAMRTGSASKNLQKVTASTTANRTLSGLTNTVLDGITPTDGQVILVNGQTDAKENGLYKAHSGAWTRLVDDNGDYVLAPGMLVSIIKGTTLADTLWACTSDSTIVGTDNINFAQELGSLADGVVTLAKLAANSAALLPGATTITAAAEGAPGANQRVITVQLKDAAGTNVAVVSDARVWISDTAAGVPSAVPPSGAVAVTTGVQLQEEVTKVKFHALCDVNGVIAVTALEAGVKNYFVNVAFRGKITSSASIAWA